MVVQGLSPGMQHCDGPDLGAEIAVVAGDVVQGLCRGTEEDRVHLRLVVKGDLGDLRRDREDEVKVRHWQQFGLARFEPFGACQSLTLRAVPIAAGNGRRPLPALWAKPVMGS